MKANLLVWEVSGRAPSLGGDMDPLRMVRHTAGLGGASVRSDRASGRRVELQRRRGEEQLQEAGLPAWLCRTRGFLCPEGGL